MKTPGRSYIQSATLDLRSFFPESRRFVSAMQRISRAKQRRVGEKRAKAACENECNYGLVLLMLTLLPLAACGGADLGSIAVHPTQEHQDEEGSLYTPATQSLLRTHSWLEEVSHITVRTDRADQASIRFEAEDDYYLTVENLPMEYLVPRLHYPAAQPPDAFDALNLMLAEYSRNSVSVPRGTAGDAMAHFETNLTETVPWRLRGDYDFVPNRYYRPQRVGIINNCLKPGLWELNAVDRSGEVYHSWFTLPETYYYDLVARVNGVDATFAREALVWRDDEVLLDLKRLRHVRETLGSVDITVHDEAVSFSSQGSRRKIARAFALYQDEEGLQHPETLSDLLRHPVAMASFLEPGIYSSREEERSTFDFSFLAEPQHAEVHLVTPRTGYRWQEGGSERKAEEGYIEMRIALANGEQLIIGNLPLHLLVQKEDFVVHGFGVGILNASGFAERRAFLFEQGPAPSYAYLARAEGETLWGLNSHGRGIEQIYIRSHPYAEIPYWEVIITSYERIVDLVKYHVVMPLALWQQQREASERFIPPIYFTYRDDNVS